MNNDKQLDAARGWLWPVMAAALVYPSLLTLVYFVWLAGSNSAAQQAAYSVGKAFQFALPLIYVGWICRERLAWPKFTTRGLLAGALFGLTISAAMLAVYFAWLKPSGLFNAAAAQVQQRLDRMGLVGPAAFAVLAVFYSLLHSLLEEYYWRWFVFGRLKQMLPLVAAIAVSSLGFMAHHVIVIGWYFGWLNAWTWLLSLSTAVGGASWAWLYHRSGSIYGPWLSHLLIDAAIFFIGYDLIVT